MKVGFFFEFFFNLLPSNKIKIVYWNSLCEMFVLANRKILEFTQNKFAALRVPISLGTKAFGPFKLLWARWVCSLIPS